MSFTVSSFLPFVLVLAFAFGAARLDRRPGPPIRGWNAPPLLTLLFALAVIGICRALWGRLEMLPLAAAAVAFAPRVERLAEGSERAAVAGPDASSRRWVAPAIAGLASLAVTWWVWSSWDPLPTVFDEIAYVLQAKIFATGRWADSVPPLPTFFDQVHVLSFPARAAKYPPGHSLMLAAGAAAGLSALVPLLFNGVAGAMLYALARRASSGTVAWLSWLVWIGCPGGLFYRSSYLSEVTTTVLWLIGWWALWNWRDHARTRDLTFFGLCVGWGFITRPLTTLAFLIPAGVFVLRATAARRSWRSLALAALPGLMVLLIIPVWSERTTGDWRVTPLQLYTRDYFPYDVPGFRAAEAPPPRRELPPAVSGVYEQFLRLGERHAIGAIPDLLRQRLIVIFRDAWGGWRFWLIAFALLGLGLLPARVRVAAWSVVLLVLLHLTYAHFPNWSVYYVEGETVLAFLTGLGLERTASALGTRLSPLRGRSLAIGGVAAALLVGSAFNVQREREWSEARLAEPTRFRASLRALPDAPAIVFVRYAPHHDPHRSLVGNGPDLAASRVWVVYDLGEKNARLCGLAPDRVPYLYDQAKRSLSRLGPGCQAPSL
jgi:hypothetical protein